MGPMAMRARMALRARLEGMHSAVVFITSALRPSKVRLSRGIAPPPETVEMAARVAMAGEAEQGGVAPGIATNTAATPALGGLAGRMARQEMGATPGLRESVPEAAFSPHRRGAVLRRPFPIQQSRQTR